MLRRRGKPRSGPEVRRELGLPDSAAASLGATTHPREFRGRVRTVLLGIALLIGLGAGLFGDGKAPAGDGNNPLETPAPIPGPSREEAFESCLRAVQLGEAERLMQLWQKSPPDPNTIGRDGKTLLGEAVAIDRPEIVRWLIEQGADPNRKSGGNAPLHWAARSASPETVGVLLAASLTVDLPNGQGETPLFLAMRPGRGGVVEKLLQAGADPNRKVGGGRAPLHQAAEWADARVVTLLITASATVNQPEPDGGCSPLHLAVISGNSDVVRILVGGGADLNARDRQGSAPLLYAASHPALTRILLEAGADVNQPGDGERTPLHEAVQAGHPDVVKLLLDHRADRGARSRRGETPLELARRLKRGEIITLLEGK